MKTGMMPNKGDYVVLDTNIISYGRRKAFGPSCTALMANMRHAGALFIVPQVVEYELWRHAQSFDECKEIRSFIEKFVYWPTSEEIFDAMTKLHILLHQHAVSKKYAKRTDVLEDMIVAATAGKNQTKTKCKTYILSGDQDFSLPYLIPVSRYDLENCKNPKESQYVFLFEIDTDRINVDWKKFCT